MMIFRRFNVSTEFFLIVGFTVAAVTGFAAELRVAPSGAAYSSIQDAVDAASPGDTILVAQGKYTHQYNRAAPAGYTGPATIRQNVFINKTVTLRGGYNATFTERDVSVYETTIDANGTGRVMYLGPDGNPLIEGFSLIEGAAAGQGGAAWGNVGGGIFCDQNSPVFISCVVGYSTADGGAGIFSSYCPEITMDFCQLNLNVADDIGGGMYLLSSGGRIENSQFYKNNSNSLAGGMYVSYEFPEIANNSFSANNATGAGGGMLLYYTGAVVTGNTIDGNSADSGAGIRSYHSDGMIHSNLILINIGTNKGAGMHLEDCTHQVVNNVIAENRLFGTSGIGSGVYVDGGTLEFLHNTLDDNYGGDGTAMYLTDFVAAPPTVLLRNQITSNHVRGIYANLGATVTMDHMLWYSNTTDWTGPGTITPGAAMLTGDPLYIDTASYNYHIQPTSAALNTGTDAGIRDDLDMHYRPWDGGFDIGADEYRVIPELGVWLDLPTRIHPDEPFFVNGHLVNDTLDLSGTQVFFMLDVYGEYWFWPSWSYYDAAAGTGVDYNTMDVPLGDTIVNVLEPFIWPDTGPATVTGLRFWGAMVNASAGGLVGSYGMVEWGYAP